MYTSDARMLICPSCDYELDSLAKTPPSGEELAATKLDGTCVIFFRRAKKGNTIAVTYTWYNTRTKAIAESFSERIRRPSIRSVAIMS